VRRKGFAKKLGWVCYGTLGWVDVRLTNTRLAKYRHITQNPPSGANRRRKLVLRPDSVNQCPQCQGTTRRACFTGRGTGPVGTGAAGTWQLRHAVARQIIVFRVTTTLVLAASLLFGSLSSAQTSDGRPHCE
jgi:hypothetical protein